MHTNVYAYIHNIHVHVTYVPTHMKSLAHTSTQSHTLSQTHSHIHIHAHTHTSAHIHRIGC